MLISIFKNSLIKQYQRLFEFEDVKLEFQDEAILEIAKKSVELPKDKKFFGPVLRINNYTADINGLKFPMLMTTNSLDLKQLYGDHAIYNYTLDEKFDEKRMIKTAKSIVDTSTDVRK